MTSKRFLRCQFLAGNLLMTTSTTPNRVLQRTAPQSLSVGSLGVSSLRRMMTRVLPSRVAAAWVPVRLTARRHFARPASCLFPSYTFPELALRRSFRSDTFQRRLLVPRCSRFPRHGSTRPMPQRPTPNQALQRTRSDYHAGCEGSRTPGCRPARASLRVALSLRSLDGSQTL
jgi:hypothetical protein